MRKPASPPLDAQLSARLQHAGTLFHAGRHLEAADAFREVIRQRPKMAELHTNLGVALKAGGRPEDAVPCFKRAIRLRPDFLAAHTNLAATCTALGKHRAALDHTIDAWRLAPDSREVRDGLIRALRRCPFDKPHAGARQVLAALQQDPDIDQQGLYNPAVRLWSSHPAIRRALEAALHGFPERGPGAGFKPMTAFLADDLIINTLCWTVVSGPALEAWLTRTRRALLDAAVNGELGRPDPRWLAAIAVQARACEWVWFHDSDERDDLIALTDLAADTALAPYRALIRAMYLPLETDPDAAALGREAEALTYDASGPRAELLRRSFVHPRVERRIADGMGSLTGSADTVSRAVRDQYEDNPYPRWLTIDRRPPVPIDQHLSRSLALQEPVRCEAALPRVLIAGCGTGRHALQTAMRYTDVDVLAIDLSVASLSYARRMADALKVRNVTFAQGDILELGSYPERFDLIESSGVLHHLDEPMRGWRVLRSLLAPRGLMRLGFYSRRARQPLEEVRRSVPEGGGVEARVQAARRALYALPEGHDARELLNSADFHSTSGLRDLLLHVQETCVDLDWIAEALSGLNLRFLGFELPDPAIMTEYRRRNPGDPQGLDLAAWDAFELDHPNLFLGMYQFWAQAEG